MSLVSLKQLYGGEQLQDAVTDYQGHYEINGVKTYAYYKDSSGKEVP